MLASPPHANKRKRGPTTATKARVPGRLCKKNHEHEIAREKKCRFGTSVRQSEVGESTPLIVGQSKLLEHVSLIEIGSLPTTAARGDIRSAVASFITRKHGIKISTKGPHDNEVGRDIDGQSRSDPPCHPRAPRTETRCLGRLEATRPEHNQTTEQITVSGCQADCIQHGPECTVW